jgi:hypothetical protein
MLKYLMDENVNPVYLKKGRGQEAAMLKEQSDGDSNPNRLNPPCRRWGFIPSWLQPEG